MWKLLVFVWIVARIAAAPLQAAPQAAPQATPQATPPPNPRIEGSVMSQSGAALSKAAVRHCDSPFPIYL